MTEAAAVCRRRGGFHPGDLGIWKDEHIAPARAANCFPKRAGARCRPCSSLTPDARPA